MHMYFFLEASEPLMCGGALAVENGNSVTLDENDQCFTYDFASDAWSMSSRMSTGKRPKNIHQSQILYAFS